MVWLRVQDYNYIQMGQSDIKASMYMHFTLDDYEWQARDTLAKCVQIYSMQAFDTGYTSVSVCTAQSIAILSEDEKLDFLGVYILISLRKYSYRMQILLQTPAKLSKNPQLSFYILVSANANNYKDITIDYQNIVLPTTELKHKARQS